MRIFIRTQNIWFKEDLETKRDIIFIDINKVKINLTEEYNFNIKNKIIETIKIWERDIVK